MDSAADCVCCQEIDRVVQKMRDLEGGRTKVPCITDHPGFEPVCLNAWGLEVAYYQYRQEAPADIEHHTQNE